MVALGEIALSFERGTPASIEASGVCGQVPCRHSRSDVTQSRPLAVYCEGHGCVKSRRRCTQGTTYLQKYAAVPSIQGS